MQPSRLIVVAYSPSAPVVVGCSLKMCFYFRGSVYRLQASEVRFLLVRRFTCGALQNDIIDPTVRDMPDDPAEAIEVDRMVGVEGGSDSDANAVELSMHEKGRICSTAKLTE